MRTASRFVPVILLAALALAHSGKPAFGASFNVDSTTDAVDANPGDGVCADAAGECTLRAAVMETNALAGADVITLPEDTFELSIPGAGEDAAATGDLDITSDLKIAGIDVDGTLIDGGGLDRIFSVDSGSGAPGSVHVEISGLTLENGHTDSDGGGILNRATLALTNVVIRQSAAARGGAVANVAGELTLMASTISDNSGSNGGGGIYNEATLTIDASTISGNEASFGGGVSNAGSDALPSPFGSAGITNSTISANSSGIGTGGSLSLTNVTIAYNREFGLSVGPFIGVNFVNTIIAYNQEEHLRLDRGSYYTGSDCDGGPGFNSLGHNLDTDGTCGLSGPGDLSHDYAGLMAPSNDGGPTQTWPLFQLYCHDYSDACDGASHAIDAGDDTKCPATDQRGMPRPFDGDGDGVARCDIGSYERQDGPRHCQTGCVLFFVTPTPSPTPKTLPPTGGSRPDEDRKPPVVAVGLIVAGLSAAAIALLRRRFLP